MQYFFSKDIPHQIRAMHKSGGHFQKAAEKVKSIFGSVQLQEKDPLGGISRTSNGESRIKNCIKYDLNGFARLITIQHEGVCVIMFFGKHPECDTWLEHHKGMNLAIDNYDKVMVSVRLTENIIDLDKNEVLESDYSEGKLYKKIKSFYFNKIADTVSYSTLEPFLELESDTDDDELYEACLKIKEKNIQEVFFDVFVALKKGDLEAVKGRISLFEEELKLLEAATTEEKEAIIPNDQFQKLSALEAEYIKGILESKEWFDWMLFLHPSQREVVDIDSTGSSKLLGVSGSGKTCVLVHRAVRLAKKYLGEKILVLTLNPSLAELIEKLISLLLGNLKQAHLQDNIEVISFWELCSGLLKQHDEHPLRERILNPKSDRHGDTIDEIWEEYYRCYNNNKDAEILSPIHQTLLVRGVFPQEYIKQEFDWVRSAFDLQNRHKYLSIEREGRKIPLSEADRSIILDGMAGWDKKMEDVGAIDYLGLANRLHQFIDVIEPKYRSILVDEIQDFGTVELKIIRKLVKEGENDLFLTGDIAQQVNYKHHKLKPAKIFIPSAANFKILKNYRNSREILEAAFAVLKENVASEDYKFDDFEILDPEFANFSSPKPFLREGKSIEEELFSAVEYLKSIILPSEKEKGCIAICGYSIFEVEQIARQINLPVLDGAVNLSEGSIFLSDLEQTKGFEFDRMIVINCKAGVLPSPNLPKEEWYKEISRLYVAMTRAKRELVISFTGAMSELFSGKEELFRQDEWNLHLIESPDILFPIPDKNKINTSTQNHAHLKGIEFLYTHSALGMSRELQSRLIDLVAGHSVFDEKGRQIGWKTIGDIEHTLTSKIRSLPTLKRIFGPSVFNELEQLMGIIKGGHRLIKAKKSEE